MRYYVKILLLLLLGTLLPCIAVFSITNYTTFAQYKELVSHSELNRLRTIGNTNQMIVENIEQSALRLSLEMDIQTLGGFTVLEQWPDKSTYLRSLMRAGSMVRDLVSTSDLFDSVYLYIHDSNYIISSRESIVNLNRFTDQVWMDKYRELRENPGAGRMIPSHVVTGGFDGSGFTSYGRRCLTYVYPITPFTSTFNGAVVFNIYEEKLLELFLGDMAADHVAIFDDQGTWLTGTTDLDFTQILGESGWDEIFAEPALEGGYVFPDMESNRYQCSYYSADGCFVFLSIQDMQLLAERTTFFTMVFIVFLLLFVPFAALLVVAFSRRLYSPIGSLAKELGAVGNEQDEWSAISRAVKELLREDQRLFSDRNRQKLRDATCLHILSGYEGDDEDEIRTAILPYARNFCGVVELDAPVVNGEAEAVGYGSRVRLLMRLLETELTGQDIQVTAFRSDEHTIALIFSCDLSAEALEPMLRKNLEALLPEARAVMEHPVSFSVGSLSDELIGVNRSFEQAKNAMQYRLVEGLECVLFHDRITQELRHYNADGRLEYIHHCLSCGRWDEFVQEVVGLINDLQVQRYVPFVHISQILNRVLNLVTEYAVDRGIQPDELLEDNAVVYQQLWRNRTLDEVREWFLLVFSAIVSQTDQSAGNEHMRRTIEYVKQNYSRNITVDSIAAHVGISYSYLRKVFKEATGENLTDYINRLRIEKAKTLLRETNYTIKAVSQMCGYNHERSFSRAFSQSEGVSPGKYKSICKDALPQAPG